MTAIISRTTFLRRLNAGVDVSSPGVRLLGTGAQRLDANRDGVLRGQELHALFDAIDRHDRSGSDHTLLLRGTTARIWRGLRAPGPVAATGFASLQRLGFHVYAVRSLQVVHADPRLTRPDLPLRRLPLGHRQLIVSGTFYAGSGGRRSAVGAVVRNGQLDTRGLDKAADRGGLAIASDGSIRMGRAAGNHLDDIRRVFGDVDHFLGGGALLIEHGRAVSSYDLAARQHFDQGGGGFACQQLRGAAARTVVAMRGSQAYVLVTPPVTGLRLQRLLARSGFHSAVLFDGGSGAYAREHGRTLRNGQNVTGLLVTY